MFSFEGVRLGAEVSAVKTDRQTLSALRAYLVASAAMIAAAENAITNQNR